MSNVCAVIAERDSRVWWWPGGPLANLHYVLLNIAMMRTSCMQWTYRDADVDVSD